MWRIDDNRLFVFTNVCEKVAKESSYLNKAKILKDFFEHGSSRTGFNGDLLVWTRMLIPSDSQRVYNLQNKQMLKLFSRLFNTDPQTMQHELEQNGDISEVLSKYFRLSAKLAPQPTSSLYLQEVDELLEELTKLTKEDEQSELLRQLCNQSTSSDLKTVVRIIKQDLRMNAKASHVLAAFGPTAYPTYQATRNLESVVEQVGLKVPTRNRKAGDELMIPKERKVIIMTPISPMLANACNSVEEAFKKCPNGLFSEIKYDGERVQIHKQGDEFRFFSRNLKPVVEHKIKRFKEFIPQAFPCSGDMILDSEIILVDTMTNELLPFGTLGAHKKKKFQNAVVCLFVFDCMLFKGEVLTNLSFQDRRKILEDNIKPLKSYVQLSEIHFLKNKNELALMVAKVLEAHLEGVVLKDPCGTYQPGKRGWIKVKKDYLYQGKMADSADLVVLGASYGSGRKGGVLSIFLMGCFDNRDFLWKTVTKVHTGLDDNARLEVHDELLKLMERSNPHLVPTWFLCNKPLLPDFVAKDPLQMPVWEITGAEFTKSGENTTAGISIRFPRITRLRNDKTAKDATDLKHLEELYEASKNNVNVDLLLKLCDQPTNDIVINGKLSVTPCDTLNTSHEISKRECKEDSKDFSRPKCLKTRTPMKQQTTMDSFTKTSLKKSEINESNLEGGVDKNRKLLIDKLLRTTQIQRIYVLVRPKAGKDINERIPHIFKDHLFEKLLKLHNNPVKYIKAIAGDCMLNNLGMTTIDRQELIENCDVIIHTAATVRFNEPLSNAISVNVQATVDLLNLAKEMKKLKAFVHVSSAFANCLDFHIEETYYTERLGITAEELLKIKRKVNDAEMDSMHSKLVNKFPNTYCYTKSVAEEAVLKLGNTLPICIFRPGIIIPTSNEPVPGWIDNLYGPTSIIYGGALGVLRVIYCRASSNAGLVPVDYCVNMIMAGAWHTATDITQIPSLKPPIYNLVPDESNTLKWTTYKSFVEGYGRKIPLASMIWYPFLLCTETYWIYKFLCFVYHTVPGYIIDTILLSMGRKRRMTRTYQKIHKTSSYLRYFTENSWTFDTSNTKYLWSLMNSQDQRLYNFDMASLDWSQYAVNSLVGMRKYLAKEEPDTIPKAKRLMRRLYILNFMVHSFVCATFFWLLWTIFNYVFPST